VNARVARNLQYGLGPVAFMELLENWRKTGKIEQDMDMEAETKGKL
jgi:aryl carrier-like protein